MVKIQKPISKTIKNDSPKLKKEKVKLGKTNSLNGDPKKVKKALTVVDENDKAKGAAFNRKKNELLNEIEVPIVQKKQFAQKPLKNGKAKKTLVSQEVLKPVETKKIKAPPSKQQLMKNDDAGLDGVLTTVKKSAQKKKPAELKAQQAFKKSVALKSAALEEELEEVILKKKHVVEKVKKPVTAKLQQPGKPPLILEEEPKKDKVILKKKETDAKAQLNTKTSFTKKNSVLQLKPAENKKQISQKKTAVAKDLETSVNDENVNTKKKSIATANVHGTKKKSGKKLPVLEVKEEIGKAPLQKKSNSKVQKKLSAKIKNATNLKNKVLNNISEVEKILHKDQDEIEGFKREKSPIFEPENFDEDKFKTIVSFENVTKILKAIKALVQNEVSKMRNTVFDDYTYFLNVASYKIPNCPKRMVKLNLKHSLVDTNVDDVVLIVPDLKRGAAVDYEPTIQHYEDILRQIGIENIKVMPFNQLRKEYTSYEAKIKLSNIYDYFLCDGRIVGQVVGFCGKHFQKPRTTIHAVNLSNPKKYKSEIEHALKRTAYRQLQRGDLISILAGNHRFTADQLAENIETIIDQLKTHFAGGYANIRNIYVKTDIPGTSSLPLYVSLAGPPDDVPNIVGPREQRMLKLKKQANEVLAKFNMSKTGDFVKLNKEQIKRKQQLIEAREALTSKKDINDVGGAADLSPPAKKKAKTQLEPENSDDSEVNDSDSADEEDDQENDEVREADGGVSEEESEESDDDEVLEAEGGFSEEESEESDDDEEESEEGSQDDDDDGEESEDDNDE